MTGLPSTNCAEDILQEAQDREEMIAKYKANGHYTDWVPMDPTVKKLAYEIVQLKQERNRLREVNAALLLLLNESGGLVKLVSQTGGIVWAHPDGSTAELQGVQGLLERINLALAQATEVNK